MKKHLFRSIIIFGGLAFVLVFIWFKGGLMFAGGEEGMPFYNVVNNFIQQSHIWYESNAGSPVVGFLPRMPYWILLLALNYIGFAPFVLQAITFGVLIFVGCISVYAVSRQLVTSKHSESIAYIASFFYVLNPFSMSQIWGRGLIAHYFTFALMPFFLLLYILSVKKDRMYLYLAIVASVIFAPAYVSPTQIIVIWVPVIFYFISLIFTNTRLVRKAFANLVLVIALWLLINIWWIVPTFILVNQVYSGVVLNPEGNLQSLLSVSYHFPFENVTTLSQRFYMQESEYYGNYYLSYFNQRMLWVPVFFVLAGLLTLFKKWKKNIFILILFAFGLFVSLGSNPPLGDLFVWFFNKFVYLQMFRNPYEKAGLLFVFAYSVLFAVGSVNTYFWIKNNYSNTYLKKITSGLYVFVIVIICFFINVPFYWWGNFSGGYKINTFVEVPEYYKQADEWIIENTKSKDTRVIDLPLIPGEGVKYDWEYSYQGVQPSEHLFNNLSINRNTSVNKPFYNVLHEHFGTLQPNVYSVDPDLTYSDFRTGTLSSDLGRLGIKYIIFHHDMNLFTTGLKDWVSDKSQEVINKDTNIRKITSFGKLDIYEIDESVVENFIEINKQDVNYQKVSPTLFKITEPPSGIININFLSNCHDGWELSQKGSSSVVKKKVYDYACQWSINSSGEEIVIEFTPQRNVNRGILISVVSTFIVFILIYQSYEKRKKTSDDERLR